MEFTSKKLEALLGVTHVALSRSLKDIDHQLKDVEGATKKVKHYKFDDLPERYQTQLKEKGIVPETKEEQSTNISPKFTQKYLLAPKAKQKEAVLKCRLVDFYMKKPSSLSAKDWLEQTLKNSLEFDELGSVSLKQLYDWYKKYRDAKAQGVNIVEAFVDARGAKRGVKSLNQEQQQTAIRYFLKTSRPMISEIYRNMCHTYGDTMPSYDVLNNFWKQWQKENPVLHEFSKSPDAAKNKYLAAFGDASAKAKYRNHYWELDSTPADVICEDGKRYTVLAAIDVFTRRVVFHVSETSSSYSISQLLRKSIIKLGIPENVVIDNGKDYTSNHFEGICVNLGINMEIVPPFSGECKPHVERVFGTLSRELFEQIPGYIGHNVAQRSELQARKSFADKIRSQEKWREEQKLKSDEERQAWRDAWKLKKENIGLELGVLLSADELQSWCDRWANDMYEQRDHGGIKKSPIKKWNNSTAPVKSIPDRRMLDLLLGESSVRKVGKKGIAFDGCNYMHINLIEQMGKYVYVMAPEDLGHILVYDEKMKFICIAEDEQYIGDNRYLARKAKKKSQQLMKQLNKIVQEAVAMKDTTILDRIEDVSDAIPAQTTAVMKHTEAVNALMNSSNEIEAADRQALENSNRYDFKNKDEDGMPTKVLPSGRPAFSGFFERFLWALENDDWNDQDEKLKNKHVEVYSLAYAEYERKKSS